MTDGVEVTFSLNKEIEDPQLRPVCAPPPVLPNKLQLITPLYCTESETVTLEQGKYRYCCPLILAKGILKVVGPETEEIQEIQLKQYGFLYQQLTSNYGGSRCCDLFQRVQFNSPTIRVDSSQN